MVKTACHIDYENKVFDAKIRGYEIKETPEVTPMKKDDWQAVFKEIKKKKLAFDRDRKAIELKRKR